MRVNITTFAFLIKMVTLTGLLRVRLSCVSEAGMIIDTGEPILPLKRNACYCPAGMFGL